MRSVCLTATHLRPARTTLPTFASGAGNRRSQQSLIGALGHQAEARQQRFATCSTRGQETSARLILVNTSMSVRLVREATPDLDAQPKVGSRQEASQRVHVWRELSGLELVANCILSNMLVVLVSPLLCVGLCWCSLPDFVGCI